MINTNLDTTPLPPNNLVAQDPQSAELAGYVRTKTFGRDVRESIARSIELNSTRSKSAEILANETLAVAETATRNMASQVELIKAEKDAVIANATQDSEVILARGGKDTLGQRLDETDAQLEQIAMSIEKFPLIIPEIDDTGRFQRAFDSTRNLILEKKATYIVKNLRINRVGFSLFGNGSKIKTGDSISSGIIISSTSQDILIEGLDFEGMADGTNDSPTGIVIQASELDTSRGSSAKNIEISRCNFLGGFVSSIVANGTTGLKIHDCYSTGNFYVPTALAGGYFILLQSCYDVDIYRNKAVASPTDRHAVYVSCNNKFTGSKINENISITDNIFDWRGVINNNNFEACIATRSTNKLHILNNKIKGGYGGILVNPSHGDFENIIISGNIVTDLLSSATNELPGIGSIGQDKGGSYKVRNLKIIDNIISAKGERIHGIIFTDTIGFEMKGNFVDVNTPTSRASQLYNSSNGIVTGNKFNGNSTGRSGIAYSGTLDNILFNDNLIENFLFSKEELYQGVITTNIKHPYSRVARISSNGSGTITVANDKDNIISGVVTDDRGCVIRLNKNAIARQGMINVTPLDSSPVRYFYNRSFNLTDNSVTLGIKSVDGVTEYPLGSTVTTFEIRILE